MKYADIYREIDRGAGAGSVSRWVVDVLTDIADGRRDLLAVRHPLGFICLPVQRSDADGVCVHLWQAELRNARSTTSQVHAHSWDLLSYVLFGEVHNEIVDVADDPANPT